MTNMLINDSDLHAYVDGRIEAARRPDVEAHLAADAAAAETVRAYRRLNRRLHEEFDAVLNEPLPHRLVRARRAGWGVHAMRAAAALLLVAVGLAGGWTLSDFAASQTDAVAAEFSERAGFIHAIYSAERRHAVEVAADERPHLVTWLTNRLGTEVKIPDLTEAGFQLVGGRLLPGESRPAAHFLYEDVDGRRVTLYMRHGDTGGHDTRFSYSSREDVGVYYWIHGSSGYAVAGDVPREDLLRVAKLAYQQLGG